MKKDYNNEVSIYGSAKDIATAIEYFNKFLNLTKNESLDRIRISELIDVYKIKAHVLYNGNSVYGIVEMVNKFKRLFKSGDMNKLTKDCYNFLHLNCGSIAHYNRHGWICNYSTIGELRVFFNRNEYGTDIVSFQPGWKTDSVEICKQLMLL